MLHKFDLVMVLCWVDDNQEFDSMVNMEQIFEHSKRLGVINNENKYSPFVEEHNFIGFIWNTTKEMVRISNGKLCKYIPQIDEFLELDNLFS